MRMSGAQLSVSQGGEAGVTALLDLSDDTEIDEREKTTTAAVFLGCVSTYAQSDNRLSEEESKSMHIEPTSRKTEVVRGTDIGRRVVQYADELERIRVTLASDQEFQNFIDNAVRATDGRRASETAFDTFTTIANQVLEVGQSGIASMITYGRIATLFLLGYELCSAFIRRHGTSLFLKFIGQLLNYLIRYLKGIGFFDWLIQHSWGHLTPDTVVFASGVGTGILLGVIIVSAVALATVWFVRRRSR